MRFQRADIPRKRLSFDHGGRLLKLTSENTRHILLIEVFHVRKKAPSFPAKETLEPPVCFCEPAG